ncbi:MAG: Adaptive-response sensory-kinase SasA [Chlamydiia bacterium]|nr:Adaptive-response sensory-kinase SasA [Chlamydiia bacterium]
MKSRKWVASCLAIFTFCMAIASFVGYIATHEEAYAWGGYIKRSLSVLDNTTLVISVADTGRGIPKDQQSKIFTQFFQTKKSDVGSGLGLGLSICKKYLDMMGGTITFVSEEGKGTTFTCKIPMHQ